ncbi:hypothetical protein [Kitasatospora cineracea]|uniref:hypothetical protein n=1 Tax=Kitasatospora cineracea TaxID=88074 RepID=UPI0037917036
MEKIIPAEGLRNIVLWPVTGLFAGTPVLVRKLTASQRKQRAEAAALKNRQAELNAAATATADAEFAKKLAEATDPAKKLQLVHDREAAAVAARQFELEQATASRKAKRSKLVEAAGAAALLLVVGGPLIWSLARPWIGPGSGLAIGVWWIAALIHAPASGKAAETAGAETVPASPEQAAADEEEDPEEEPVPAPRQDPSPAAPVSTTPTPADARLAVALLGASGAHVALTSVTAHLAAQHPGWRRSGKAVRALLAEAGVLYRGGVRVDGVSVPGIHRDDVPPIPSPTDRTPERVVVAGQSNNNNANNVAGGGGGEGFITRPDPNNPARTIVVHTAA